jgi:hypothetical protein
MGDRRFVKGFQEAATDICLIAGGLFAAALLHVEMRRKQQSVEGYPRGQLSTGCLSTRYLTECCVKVHLFVTTSF